MKIFKIQSKNKSVDWDWVPPTCTTTWTSIYIISTNPPEFHTIEVKFKILQTSLYHRSSLIV